jgi:hypothetical protein
MPLLEAHGIFWRFAWCAEEEVVCVDYQRSHISRQVLPTNDMPPLLPPTPCVLLHPCRSMRSLRVLKSFRVLRIFKMFK